MYLELLKTLFITLLEREGRSDYALCRYDAARICASFIVQMANEAPTAPECRAVLRSAVDSLAIAYRAGNTVQRRCIVDGILEHVFVNEGARAQFSAWTRDSMLKDAYAQACESSRDIG